MKVVIIVLLCVFIAVPAIAVFLGVVGYVMHTVFDRTLGFMENTFGSMDGGDRIPLSTPLVWPYEAPSDKDENETRTP
jgi:hypothetical protein